jgi:hypothetical protein
MRIPPKPQVLFGLLCVLVLLILITGCSNPSSQTLASLSVTATPSTLSVGGTAVLKATAHLSDGTTHDVTSGTQWTLSNTAVATMASGALTAKAPGTVMVQAAYVEATPAGSSPASSGTTPENLSASTQVTISSSPSTNTPAISWSAPAAISYGTALSTTQLNATANMAGTFTYTPAAGTVLKTGSQNLSVLFTPTDTNTYSSATVTVQLTVNQAVPTITWAAPAPIAIGTALGSAQLDATANVPGAFVYLPAAGNVPAAGTAQLSAAFTPTDTTNYASTTAKNSLVVGATGGPSTGPIGPPLTGCGGPTINVNGSMSQSTLQSTISSASSCSLIVFAAGTYNITAPINIPCNVTITGPTASPATAILAATFTGNRMFSVGNCTTPVTIGYLHFENTGAIYVTAPMSGITVTHNQFTHLPGDENQFSDMGIYFDGVHGGTISNAVVTNNTFGDPTSCTGVMSQNTDDGGLCIGIFFQGDLNGVTVENNTFTHLEEGFHVLCYGNLCTGSSSPSWTNFTVQWNDFNNIHRIAAEMQPQNASNVTMQYNSYENAFAPSTFSMGFSLACCAGISGATVPYINNNVLLANIKPAGSYIAYAIEWWGNGAQANNDVIQGYWANGIVWGQGGGPWQVENTIIEGPYMSGGEGCSVCNENEGATTTPTQSGNTVSTTVTPVTSTAPTISPAGGAISGATTVTLANSGTNHSVYYTTDGSTPTTSSTLYTGSFSVNPGTTVHAIGMWGQGANPTSYPSGYGYVPSSVVTASYTSASAVKHPGANVRSALSRTDTVAPQQAAAAATGAELTSVAVVPAQAAVAIGSATQLKAIATFSDGSTRDVTASFAWTSSDTRTITASSSGLVSGLATGKATITGSYQGRQISVPAVSTIGQVDWSGPIVITEAGAYSGNWRSTDGKTPAVTVATTAPVVIENSHISSTAGLIKTSVAGADVTVRNSLGFAVNSAVKGQANGVFLDASSPARLDVENNYVENAGGGVLVHSYSGKRDGQQTIVIRANRARNLNGLLSDGKGGYLPGVGSNQSVSRFIELDKVQSVPGIDVGWNEVINYPGHSLVADNIAVKQSSGTANQPLEIHDTYIQGAYPYNAAQTDYAGGGIKTEGSPNDSAEQAPAFSSIHDNQVVGTENYGIKFTAGHDNTAANNRVISSGMLADGTRLAAQHVGMANGEVNGASASMYNNTMHDNLIGYACWNSSCSQSGYRKDQSFPASPADYSTNSVLAAQPITPAMENGEYQIWLNKTASAGIAVGPAF